MRYWGCETDRWSSGPLPNKELLLSAEAVRLSGPLPNKELLLSAEAVRLSQVTLRVCDRAVAAAEFRAVR
jgi:hypothetical protein